MTAGQLDAEAQKRRALRESKDREADEADEKYIKYTDEEGELEADALRLTE